MSNSKSASWPLDVLIISDQDFKKYLLQESICCPPKLGVHLNDPDPPLKAYIKEGLIINNESFVIQESYRMLDGEKTEVREKNEVYYFTEFNPKPDITNTVLN